MNSYYDRFFDFLEKEDKPSAVRYALQLMENGEIDIVTLYEQILAPSLYNMSCRVSDHEWCVWKEHERTAIVRTIIECCYPYLLREMEKSQISQNRGRVIVFCPSEEYHETGARMAADFFTLCGFQADYVGSNTPREDLVAALEYMKPVIVAISVTSHYNLVAAAKTIGELRKSKYKNYKIVVGGQAFSKNPEAFREIGADIQVSTFQDIEKLSREV